MSRRLTTPPFWAALLMLLVVLLSAKIIAERGERDPAGFGPIGTGQALRDAGRALERALKESGQALMRQVESTLVPARVNPVAPTAGLASAPDAKDPERFWLVSRLLAYFSVAGDAASRAGAPASPKPGGRSAETGGWPPLPAQVPGSAERLPDESGARSPEGGSGSPGGAAPAPVATAAAPSAKGSGSSSADIPYTAAGRLPAERPEAARPVLLSGALPPEAPRMSARPLLFSARPSVYVYHTHNRESWLSVTEAKGRKDAMDAEMNITAVGRAFAEALEAAGIPVYHETTDIYALLQKDGLPYRASYDKSKTVALAAMAQHPDIRYLFDLHRDAMPRKATTATIDGTTFARILFVIGKGNPHWEKNKALAEALARRLEAKKPGLVRPMIVHEKNRWYNGEYNQSLAENALTVEIGGQENTPEEAIRSARVLAEVVAEYILEAQPVSAPPDPLAGGGETR
ncbi:stage II sporulation protein P [Hydrogenibacillus schlegelii]|uniref:Stage II sporulation protein P n=1 Tax=Hydrogenibacillus schlegelii TaxID=1484 RepID=A0A179IUG0_HYDSH|nr:stage II sporulation protein P [Hydrogenibacillus schlegelii]OAR05391.1 hypothetical protein SA87_10845 [Hydrogenibacillus schlegelii]